MKDLKGKNVVITGAACGIGKLMAENFAAQGASLALIDISKEGLAGVEDELSKKGARVLAITCDISDAAKVSDAVDKVRKELGPVDVMVNNAGIVVGKTFVDLTLDEMKRTMNVNFWGHIHFTKALIDEMMERDSGVIVNVASSGGLLGMPTLSDYGASKFAEVGFSEALRRELKNARCRGVTVTCVCPYTIDTGMFKGFRAFRLSPLLKPEKVAKRIVKAVKKRQPYVRMPVHSIHSMIILKALLPTGVFDRILTLAGGSRAMESFTGRKGGETHVKN